ncbi:MAG: hypothetical protein GY808_00005 [Gammaproteobacteria bacterium]|nr:hypothetical protein [Gammaproteobacteria bacterium]
MFTFLKNTLLLAATVGIVAHSSLLQAGNYKKSHYNNNYQVTITNLTNSISFTPILVSSHGKGVSIVELGSEASDEVTAIAEGGDITSLAQSLSNNAKVIDVQNSEGLLAPGQSVTVEVSAKSRAKYISLISMMLPTNDESCLKIPGPFCFGEGPSELDAGEGYVHIHSGIHGILDLPAVKDWKNPVAKITISRTK